MKYVSVQYMKLIIAGWDYLLSSYAAGEALVVNQVGDETTELHRFDNDLDSSNLFDGVNSELAVNIDEWNIFSFISKSARDRIHTLDSHR